jgi:arylsulfatase A-like enzyme
MPEFQQTLACGVNEAEHRLVLDEDEFEDYTAFLERAEKRALPTLKNMKLEFTESSDGPITEYVLDGWLMADVHRFFKALTVAINRTPKVDEAYPLLEDLWEGIYNTARPKTPQNMARWENPRQNVIVILLDSLRADHVGCYGNDWIKTPVMDKLAANGFKFSKARIHNNPTLPMRLDAFTGRFGLRSMRWGPVPANYVTMAELLGEQQVSTALITDTPHMRSNRGFTSGFDHIDFIRGHEADLHIIDPRIKVDVDAFHKEDPKRVRDSAGTREQTEQILLNCHGWKSDEDSFVAQCVKSAIDWLKGRQKGEQFMLWLDSFDPHEPWNPMPPFDTMYTDKDYKGQQIIQPIAGTIDYLEDDELNNIKKLYAGKVSQCDKWVGILLKALEEMGLAENTSIIFTSDHGEPFGEHGFVRKAEPRHYAEETDIPLIIRQPNGVGAGKSSDALTMPPDLFPTIFELLGLEPPAFAQGKSLVPVTKGEASEVWPCTISGKYDRDERIEAADGKVLLRMFKDAAGNPVGEDHLFDLNADPTEKKNIIADHPEEAERLKKLSEEFWKEVSE